MAKQRYSDSDRSEMVRILAESGGNLSEAARRTGWPRKTIEYVARHLGVRSSAQEPALSPTRGNQKGRRGTHDDVERAVAGWQGARDLSLAELQDPAKVKRASLKDNGVIAGIAQDKLNILTGGPTQRIDYRGSLMGPGPGKIYFEGPNGQRFYNLRDLANSVIDEPEDPRADGYVRELPSGESADAPGADAR